MDRYFGWDVKTNKKKETKVSQTDNCVAVNVKKGKIHIL